MIFSMFRFIYLFIVGKKRVLVFFEGGVSSFLGHLGSYFVLVYGKKKIFFAQALPTKL